MCDTGAASVAASVLRAVRCPPYSDGEQSPGPRVAAVLLHPRRAGRSSAPLQPRAHGWRAVADDSPALTIDRFAAITVGKAGSFILSRSRGDPPPAPSGFHREEAVNLDKCLVQAPPGTGT